MGKHKGSIGSRKLQLVSKAKEAALCAIKIYNDPLIRFKSESFTVLMIIAWTYLLHAYYRGKGVDYRYFKTAGNRRKYDRTTHGAYKHWELERCLNEPDCPIDGDMQKNLRFLIGLRHEIEHQMAAAGLDAYLSSRYQACAVNFNDWLTKLFGAPHRLDEHLQFSIQFAQLDPKQFEYAESGPALPKALMRFVEKFDRSLTADEFNSPKFAYRLLFTKKLVNRPGQADKVVEFIDPKSELAHSISKEYWVKKEVERPKFRPKDVVTAVQKAGFPQFKIQPQHLDMWKEQNAKEASKGYGVEVAGQWYWYQNWIDRCIELCRVGGTKHTEP
jgi:hypothetical protein